jgi:hypothetical protein
LEFRTVVGPNKARLPPVGDDSLVEEVSGSPAVQRRGRDGLYPLGERVDRHQKVAISFLVGGKRPSGVNTPSSEGDLSFVDPA